MAELREEGMGSDGDESTVLRNGVIVKQNLHSFYVTTHPVKMLNHAEGYAQNSPVQNESNELAI